MFRMLKTFFAYVVKNGDRKTLLIGYPDVFCLCSIEAKLYVFYFL